VYYLRQEVVVLRSVVFVGSFVLVFVNISVREHVLGPSGVGGFEGSGGVRASSSSVAA